MIISMKPLALAEVKGLVKDLDEKKQLNDYMKEFCKISEKDAAKLREEVVALNNIKIKEEHIAKLIDVLPKDAEEVNKVFSDVSLDETETNTILNVVGKY